MNKIILLFVFLSIPAFSNDCKTAIAYLKSNADKIEKFAQKNDSDSADLRQKKSALNHALSSLESVVWEDENDVYCKVYLENLKKNWDSVTGS